MKKRVFSLLLSLCLVAGLFAGMGATAYADGDTITVTLKQGDTVAKICENLGIDFNANREWITKTNKISNYATLPVGRVLTLPAPGKVLTYVEPSTTSTSTSTTTTATSTAAATSTTYGVPTVSYTLKNGDFVSTICQALKIDFKANEAWIKAANNITSFNNLKVGRTIILPAPGTTPALSTVPTTTATTATTLTATTTTTTAGLLSGDTVSYYLNSYVVKSGDTLYNICRSVGANMDTVQSINNITNAARLSVGQTLKIPSSAASSTGSSVAVVAHRVVSGDTVQGICNQYGVSYDANAAATIKGLNNISNLNAIKVGQILLIPVPATRLTTTTTTGGTTTGTTAGTGTTAAVNSATSASTFYAINKTYADQGTINGTYSLTVNGQAVNSASANQTVHVVVMPDHGYKLDKITVMRNYNGQAIAVDENNNFVMPQCDVRVVVSFAVDPDAAPHQVYNSSVTERNVIAIVNGYNQTSVEPGKAVKLVLNELPSGAVIDKIVVSTVNPTARSVVADGKLEASSIVSLSADYSFVMPKSDVYVTVLLKGA